jgi:hypothetical protein
MFALSLSIYIYIWRPTVSLLHPPAIYIYIYIDTQQALLNMPHYAENAAGASSRKDGCKV